ncbi:isoamylase early set domain-containing protein [Gelidibacter sp.]|uniref:isoamylase early set domain-containing protein n=1 Tax=Gelidibacter sp. TaxID=2018083 RepID=UPI002CD1F599|nr:isoamylase early set domain-containing protein [Gelidibacter sp.]HUH26853.1 isoamylase early set domain-containing protein [Gelidibacter sp.]
MAITKQYLKSKPICKVTFSVPAEEAKKVSVLGTFNDWNEKKALQLKKLKNGTFKGTIDLEKDNSYEFKYLVDGTFTNEENADAYKTNEFGGENGVLNL